jgi:hypothetical protein
MPLPQAKNYVSPNGNGNGTTENVFQRQAAIVLPEEHAASSQLLPTQIRAEASAQQRVQMNAGTVEDYADAIKVGAIFPPLMVFFDGTVHWLADGFHRLNAHKLAFGDQKPVHCRIMQGSRRDALRCALGANANHGLRRSAEDKRKSVQTALADDEWSGWSDRELAKLCKVTHPFVGTVRRALIAPSGNVTRSESPNTASIPAPSGNVTRSEPPITRKFERGGKTYEMQTASINGQRATANNHQSTVDNLDSIALGNERMKSVLLVWIQENLKTTNTNTLIGTLSVMLDNSNRTRMAFIDYLHTENIVVYLPAIVRAINDLIAELRDRKEEKKEGAGVAPVSKLEIRVSPEEHTHRKYALAAKILALLQLEAEFKALFGKNSDWVNFEFECIRTAQKIESLGFPE